MIDLKGIIGWVTGRLWFVLVLVLLLGYPRLELWADDGFLLDEEGLLVPGDEDEIPGKGWLAESELGFLFTRGNSETRTTKGKLELINDRDRWRNGLTLESLSAVENDQTSAERYSLNNKNDYKYVSDQYIFLLFNVDADRFAGFEYETTGALGYGWRLIDQSLLTVDAEMGPGYRRTKFNDGLITEEAVGRLALAIYWRLSATAFIEQSARSEIGTDKAVSKSATALTTQINGRLATKLSYTVKHTSDVPEDVKKIDTEVSVTLVYSFR